METHQNTTIVEEKSVVMDKQYVLDNIALATDISLPQRTCTEQLENFYAKLREIYTNAKKLDTLVEKEKFLNLEKVPLHELRGEVDKLISDETIREQVYRVFLSRQPFMDTEAYTQLHKKAAIEFIDSLKFNKNGGDINSESVKNVEFVDWQYEECKQYLIDGCTKEQFMLYLEGDVSKLGYESKDIVKDKENVSRVLESNYEDCREYLVDDCTRAQFMVYVAEKDGTKRGYDGKIIVQSPKDVLPRLVNSIDDEINTKSIKNLRHYNENCLKYAQFCADKRFEYMFSKLPIKLDDVLPISDIEHLEIVSTLIANVEDFSKNSDSECKKEVIKRRLELTEEQQNKARLFLESLSLLLSYASINVDYSHAKEAITRIVDGEKLLPFLCGKGMKKKQVQNYPMESYSRGGFLQSFIIDSFATETVSEVQRLPMVKHANSVYKTAQKRKKTDKGDKKRRRVDKE